MASIHEANKALRFNHNKLFSNNNLIYAAVVPKRDSYGNFINDYFIETGVKSLKFQNEIIKTTKDTTNYSLIVPNQLEIPIKKIIGTSNVKYVTTRIVESKLLNANSYDYPIKPAIGGVSIGNLRYPKLAGTLGATLKFKNNQKTYLLSNWHILWGRNGKRGDEIMQPAPRDHGVKRVIALASKGFLSNKVDAAVAEVLNPSLVKSGTIDFGPLKALKRARLLANVKKSGKRSELTTGRILSINASCRIRGPYENGSKIFINQIMTTLMTASGDSGSLLCDTNNNVVGLLFSGDGSRRSFANHIKNVFPNKNVGFKTLNLSTNQYEPLEFESFLD